MSAYFLLSFSIGIENDFAITWEQRAPIFAFLLLPTLAYISGRLCNWNKNFWAQFISHLLNLSHNIEAHDTVARKIYSLKPKHLVSCISSIPLDKNIIHLKNTRTFREVR